MSDVLIIGSGAGGGAAAYALTRAGLTVTILEAGPHYDYLADYRMDRQDWEQPFPDKDPPHASYAVAPLQPLDADLADLRSWNHISGLWNPSEQRISMGYHHVRGVGGSTLHFTGEAHRLHPEAFQLFSRTGIGADWPIDYAELEPYYLEAETVIGVAGRAESSRWRSAPYPLPDHRLSHASSILRRGFEKAGLACEPNALAILSAPYDDRPPCNGCNGCLRGCPLGDKGSVDVTFLRHALATGRCTIRSNCDVLTLEAGPDDTVTGVVASENGQLVRAGAPIIILAAGAVHSPRLLLNSANAHAPDGLANESGEVGRNFMETISWTSSALHPESLGSHRGQPVDMISWSLNAPDAVEGIPGGFRFSPAQAESDLVGPINYATRVVPGWGRQHKQAMRATFGHVLSVAGLCESVPHEQSKVTLSTALDRHGLPKPLIHSFLDSEAIARIAFMARTCRSILAYAGAGAVFEQLSSYDMFSSTHVFGTCRMGDDPQTSVVDRLGRAHRWRNLYIADASIFPSSGGGESPSLTIQALALRTAAGIATNR
ncbi:GMC family oxidoreductase [Devosia chinhatensis]|uniref:Membrane protein n=1 Tax=Devosia chinhatensis TaxID=429727 RepID=A0A0F5FK86_9HYPH|nr:GMC family oxidoreductase [Devosia chinhatensis]KKB08612.1 membrane protein [Devosia chinhatensis]